jgi:hypothetical protein
MTHLINANLPVDKTSCSTSSSLPQIPITKHDPKGNLSRKQPLKQNQEKRERERERERRKFTSTVGFPLLSKIWRALIDLMIAIARL